MSFAISNPKVKEGARATVHHWRLGLVTKNHAVLDKEARLLSSNHICRVNIPNKKNDDHTADVAALLRQQTPCLDICVHYSLKHNYDRNIKACLERFISFCNRLAALGGNISVLLVSGGGKKQRNNTVAILQELQSSGQDIRMPLYVAFNPYLPSKSERTMENERLQHKLKTGMVSGIYLQMGTDLHRLEQSVAYIRRLVAELGPSECVNRQPLGSREAHQDITLQNPGPNGGLQILGSVLLPSKRLLAQMRFRPWGGVFLSEEYLGSVEEASRFTCQLLQAYGAHGVMPLFEGNITTTSDVRRIHDIMASAKSCQLSDINCHDFESMISDSHPVRSK